MTSLSLERLGGFSAAEASRNAFQNIVPHRLRKVTRLILQKCFTISDEDSKAAPALCPLVDNDPMTVGAGFNGVDRDRCVTDWQRDALDESCLAREI